MKKRKSQRDTSISLHPLSFEDALKELASPKREDSEAEASDNTGEDAPVPAL